MQEQQQFTNEPPEHYSDAAKRFWREVHETREFDPHEYHTLHLAAEALMRHEQARESLEANGLVYIDRFDQPKPRPEAAIARDSAVLFARLCRELRLDIDGGSDPRLPRDTRRYG